MDTCIDGVCNAAPVAVDDEALLIIPDDEGVEVHLLANDHDPEGQTLLVESVEGLLPDANHPVTGGTLFFQPDGHLRFTPNPGFFGEVTLGYVVSDPGGATAEAIVCDTNPDGTLAVQPVLMCGP